MSESYCDVDFEDAADDLDPVDMLVAREVTARKAATCCECRGPIAVGEKYRRASYRFEGTFHVDRVCEPCREAVGEFTFQMLGGFFWEFMREEWANGANVQGCINRLTTAKAKEHMRQQWLKWQERRTKRPLPAPPLPQEDTKG